MPVNDLPDDCTVCRDPASTAINPLSNSATAPPALVKPNTKMKHDLVNHFPHHFVRILIFPNTKKDRLSESVISCPFRKFYLAHHHRLDPVTPFHFGSSQSLAPTIPASRRKIKEGTFINPNFVRRSFAIEILDALLFVLSRSMTFR
jgi:hypothetical protein